MIAKWAKKTIPNLPPKSLRDFKARPYADITEQVSGGEKYRIFPFTGEFLYRCFSGCQKYFCGPVRSPYEISSVKVYVAYFSPPEAGGPRGGLHAERNQQQKDPGLAQEVQNTLFCPLHEKFHAVVLKRVRNMSDTF